MKKVIGQVNTHSVIDVITNSSTELFCTVKGKTEEMISNVLEEIKKEFGCDAVSFSICGSEIEDKDGNYTEFTTQFDISYDHECYHAPCDMMIKKIKETLNAE